MHSSQMLEVVTESGDGAAPDLRPPLVEVLSVSVRYGRVTALEDISFTLGQGERVAVVGPNGAGKSTLFKVVTGLVEPTAGRVVHVGRGREVALVRQRNEVDWSFPVNVRDVVMMGRIGHMGLFGRPDRHDRQVVERSLELLGLSGLAQRQIQELSGGQQQRMFIARALAQEATLVLMDEPLTGLDIKSQDALYQILDTLRAEGVTVLIATHDLDQAAAYFDRVMLLNRRLVAFGDAREVLTSDNLSRAYGNHLQLLDTGDGVMVLADTCCDGGEHHG